jgi:hypothetical protein
VSITARLYFVGARLRLHAVADPQVDFFYLQVAFRLEYFSMNIPSILVLPKPNARGHEFVVRLDFDIGLPASAAKNRVICVM